MQLSRGILFFISSLLLSFQFFVLPVYSNPIDSEGDEQKHSSIFSNNLSFSYNPLSFSESFLDKQSVITGNISHSFGWNINMFPKDIIAFELSYIYNNFYINRNDIQKIRTDINGRMKLGYIFKIHENIIESKIGLKGLWDICNPKSYTKHKSAGETTDSNKNYLDFDFQLFSIGGFADIGIRPIENIPWRITTEFSYMPYVALISDTTKTGLPTSCQDIYFSIGTQYNFGNIYVGLKCFSDALKGGTFQQNKNGIVLDLGISFTDPDSDEESVTDDEKIVISDR